MGRVYTLSSDTTRIWDSNPFPGMIRLQGGTYSNEGRVEVYCNGVWGTVCDDEFGYYEAITICKQLGYSTYANYGHFRVLVLMHSLYCNHFIYIYSRSSNASQPIWFDNVDCVKGLSCWGSCQRCPTTQYHNCDHSEDVIIECSK